jgi:hypothetical protein
MCCIMEIVVSAIWASKYTPWHLPKLRYCLLSLKNLCKALHKFFYAKQKIMQSNLQKPSWISSKTDLALHNHFT